MVNLYVVLLFAASGYVFELVVYIPKCSITSMKSASESAKLLLFEIGCAGSDLHKLFAADLRLLTISYYLSLINHRSVLLNNVFVYYPAKHVQ